MSSSLYFLLLDSMCMDPSDRKQYLQEKVDEIFSQNEILQEFGLDMDTSMARWHAGNSSM